jgi:hypothetical protein
MPVRRATVPVSPPKPLEPAPRQSVTLDVAVQPLSSDDVYVTGRGRGWVDPPAAQVDRLPPVATYSGPLFRGDPSPADVHQGQLGDCFLAAGLAGLAYANPQAIRDLIKPTGDGSLVVTFHERDALTGQFKPVEIHVDPELYEARDGSVLYGHAKGDRASMELWFPLVEKAYAQWKGGYETVGWGGTQNQVFEAVLGRPAGWLAISETSNRQVVWDTLEATLKAGLPIGAATNGYDDGRYANSGVHSDHGYSVLGTQVEGAQRYVVLRNPWGEGEPRGDGVDDGVFRLPLEDFVRLFGQLQFTLV